MEPNKLDGIRVVLDSLRGRLQGSDPWPYLGSTPPESLSKQDANKFLLGAALQYQDDADRVWRNVDR